MREHKHQKESGGQQEDTGSSDQITPAALMKCDQTKRFLMGKAAEAANAVSTGANVFQMTVRGMQEEELQKEINGAAAEQCVDGVVDRVWDNYKEKIAEAGEVSLDLVEHSSVVFSVIKGTVKDRIKGQQQLSVMQVADYIAAGMVDKSLLLESGLRQLIQSFSHRKLLGIWRALMEAQGAKSDYDSEENGFIADGLKDSILCEIGMPPTDKVASEQYAIAAFSQFQMGIINAMPAHEAGEKIQDRLKNPDGDKKAVQETEEQKMGPEYKEQLEHDRKMRGRVEAET